MDDPGNECEVAVDGVDCLVEGISKMFCSHKFKKAALRCELATCIRTGWLVWTHGPFPCGDWPDSNMFRDELKSFLSNGECVEADDGHKAEDPESARAPGAVRYMGDKHWHQKRGKARKRHETANQRTKVHNALANRFRHACSKHSVCFRACAVLSQLSFELGKRSPFEVRNHNDKWRNRERCPVPGDIIPGDEEHEECE